MHFHFVIPVLPYPLDVDFYDRVAASLERRGAAVALVALSRAGEQQLRRSGHPHVHYLYERYHDDAPADPAGIARIERQYRLDCIADHVFPEKRYFGGTAAQLASRALYTFQWLERFLEEHSAGVFVNNVGGELIRRTMARMAEAGAGPRNVIIDFAPLHGRITLTTDETSWDDLASPPPPLTPEERAFTERYLAEATSGRKMFARLQPLGVDLGSLYRPLRNLARALTSSEQRDEKLSYVYRERVQHLARRAVAARFFEQPVDGEPYVFFPLHVPFDSAITIRAPQFQNQDNLLEYLAERALPTGHRLYVKPHPAGRDTYPIPMLRRIARLPGVRLIEPRVNSHQMIAGAKAVVVINSTAGYESLLYLKPTVVLGRVFYRGHGPTTDLENLGDLRQALHHAIQNPPDRELVLRFLHAIWKATTPGAFGKLEPENVENVAVALLDKARRLGVEQALPAAASR